MKQSVAAWIRNRACTNVLAYCYGRALGGIIRQAIAASGEQTVDGIIVVGSESFLNAIVESVGLLRRHDPGGYALVRRYLRKIVATDQWRTRGYIAQVAFEEVDANGLPTKEPLRIGPYLVRCAVLARIFVGFRIPGVFWGEPRCTRVALQREMKSLKALGCSEYYINLQDSELRRIHVQ